MDYSFKVLICMLFFLPMYGVVLKMILQRLLRSGAREQALQPV
ncbi:hypothetical protein PWG14_01730 (plasmid) [Chromobacterium amazonense]|nr:hypothetical protein [Chromobacterium amazonense]MDE1711514.1 hypothetical protein [Chromobacterium amazonense]